MLCLFELGQGQLAMAISGKGVSFLRDKAIVLLPLASIVYPSQLPFATLRELLDGIESEKQIFIGTVL